MSITESQKSTVKSTCHPTGCFPQLSPLRGAATCILYSLEKGGLRPVLFGPGYAWAPPSARGCSRCRIQWCLPSEKLVCGWESWPQHHPWAARPRELWGSRRQGPWAQVRGGLCTEGMRKALEEGEGAPRGGGGRGQAGVVEISGGRCMWWEAAELKVLRSARPEMAAHVELAGGLSF